jgi:hypothetical protein
MKTFPSMLLLSSLLLTVPAAAMADDWDEGTAQPSPAPTTQPPPPPAVIPAPPAEQPPAPAQPAAPEGQWVYTNQYGWVWMPHATSYTYVPPSGGEPQMYLYYPTVGWTWVVAPWIWGWGPAPYFAFGASYFPWYGYGYGHWYGYAGHYGYGYRCGYYHGGAWHAPPAHYPAYGGGRPPPMPLGGYGAPGRAGYGAPGRVGYGAPSHAGYGAPAHAAYAAPRGGGYGGGYGGGGGARGHR